MDPRALAEHVLERLRIHRGDSARIERPDALLQLERACERGLHRDLLVEREADEERERLTGDQLVRLVRVGEVERLGHDRMLEESLCRGPRRRIRLGL